MFYSPLEQFHVYPLIFYWNNVIDLSFTNMALFNIIIVFSFLICLEMILSAKNQIYFFPNNWQIILETIYLLILDMVRDNIGEKGQKFFPFVFTIFLYVFLSNLIGLIPYSFTITSHFDVTLTIAKMVFFVAVFISYQEYGKDIILFFMPAGTSLPLAFILIPIEIVSYIFKPISMGLRLFVNMTAGHTLLKVLAGFSWMMMSTGGILFIAHFIPLLLIVILIGLELAVCIIQTYVFTLLTCIYLNDAFNCH